MKQTSEYLLLFSLLLAFLFFPLNVIAIGESSIITLEFPAGAENTGQAECGVSLSNSINTMFWNPASLPAVYDNLQSRIQTGYFSEHPLNIKQVDHSFLSGALFFNDLMPRFDIAYGFYRNELVIGKDNESVVSHCIGVRALDIISLGISLKRFNSEMTYDSSDKKTKSNGFAFDLGARFEHTARIASTPMTISPELGVSLVNLGKDSSIVRDEKKPLPRGFNIGSSLTTQYLEFLSYTITAEARASLLKLHNDSLWLDSSYFQRGGGHDLVASVSNKFQITPFYSYGFGYMIDYNGRRFEFHDVHTFTFDARKLMTLIYRIKNHDLEPESEKIQKFQERFSFYKGKIKPNLRFSYSTSNISSIDGDARDGQRGFDFSLGF